MDAGLVRRHTGGDGSWTADLPLCTPPCLELMLGRGSWCSLNSGRLGHDFIGVTVTAYLLRIADGLAFIYLPACAPVTPLGNQIDAQNHLFSRFSQTFQKHSLLPHRRSKLGEIASFRYVQLRGFE